MLTTGGLDRGRIKEALREILTFIEGSDRPRDGLRDTPHRVVESWKELYGGYAIDVPSLFTTFDQNYDQMVVARNIEFWSMCEHHMLPFFGVAHVAYLPARGKVVGLSKMARVVDAFARRLQIQERLCQQVTEALDKYLNPKGSACVIAAKHMCVACRGVGKQQMDMVTSSVTGCFRHEPETRAELFALIGEKL